ncbi:MAG: hypothetical protein WBA35_04050 [Litorimonas sp.]
MISLDSRQTDVPADVPILERLNMVRLVVVLLCGLGYASTMAIGPGAREWLNLFGYDPSLYGIQVLFFISGWLAWRSLESGRGVRAFIASRARRVLPWVALYTLIVVAVLYPVLCDHDAARLKSSLELGAYFLKTLTLIQPGQPMPGALDNALYACELQGTIWTLRWGAIAFVGLLALHALRIRQRWVYGTIFLALLAAHVGANVYTDRSGSAVLEPVIPGLRLAFPFILGVIVRQNARHLPGSAKGWGMIALVALGAAASHYSLLPWSYAIEPLAMIGWGALAMSVLHSRSALVANWPAIVVPVYLGAWPIAQTWLFAHPDITVPALVVTTLATTVALALAFRLAAAALADRVAGRIHGRVQPA